MRSLLDTLGRHENIDNFKMTIEIDKRILIGVFYEHNVFPGNLLTEA